MPIYGIAENDRERNQVNLLINNTKIKLTRHCKFIAGLNLDTSSIKYCCYFEAIKVFIYKINGDDAFHFQKKI
jgi:hypothetical protein